uniref:Uncharacterized protein n=1 Tax=Anguilla anguilla TaxID=7936 RepID=A0A0E9UU73_ANGAN
MAQLGKIWSIVRYGILNRSRNDPAFEQGSSFS